MSTTSRSSLQLSRSRFPAWTICWAVAALLAPSVVLGAKPDDPGRVKFRGAAFPIEEEAGAVTIVVKRQSGSAGAVQVSYQTTAGSAIASEDYEPTQGTLQWADGDRADKSFAVTILDDDLDEGQETFGLRLFDPVVLSGNGQLQISSPSSAIVRIKPSDRNGDDGNGGGNSGPGAGRVQFRGAAFPIEEEAGAVTVVVKRQNGSSGDVQVSYRTTPGRATADEDYEPTAGTLQWNDGDRSDKSFRVTILDDDLDEGEETFGVELFDPVVLSGGGTLELSPPSTAVVRIKPSDRDDNGGGGGGGEDGNGVLKLTAVAFPAFESSGEAVVSVERHGGDDGAVSVQYATIPGSATEGDDYTRTEGSLSWRDSEDGEKSFVVALVDDAIEEDLETVTVVLTAPTGGARLGGRDVGSIVIIDDDGGSGECVPDPTTLCLLDGRFQITGGWRDFDSNAGPIQWIPSTDESGLGWFFSESNIELLLKVLDACVLNDYLWVFFAATTNVAYEIEVTDLATGAVQSYSNDLGEVALAVTDTTAFACSP